MYDEGAQQLRCARSQALRTPVGVRGRAGSLLAIWVARFGTTPAQGHLRRTRIVQMLFESATARAYTSDLRSPNSAATVRARRFVGSPALRSAWMWRGKSISNQSTGPAYFLTKRRFDGIPDDR